MIIIYICANLNLNNERINYVFIFTCASICVHACIYVHMWKETFKYISTILLCFQLRIQDTPLNKSLVHGIRWNHTSTLQRSQLCRWCSIAIIYLQIHPEQDTLTGREFSLKCLKHNPEKCKTLRNNAR